MTNRDLTLRFIERFCAGDVEGLVSILAENLQFRGPFHQFESREGYLTCLRNDPPVPSQFQVVSITESEDQVAVFFEYQKSNESVLIAQLFKCFDNQITEILLIFDGRGFVPD